MKAAEDIKCSPFRPHPHNLVEPEGCKNGVYSLDSINITPQKTSIVFQNLRFNCVKKNEISNSLQVRVENLIDPFQSELILYFYRHTRVFF